MATNKHIDNLKSIREKLVELRRARAAYGVKNDAETAAAHIIDVQMKIDVLDKAITEETELLPPQLHIKKLKA